ncbi:uncharacterized protein LOC132031942 [Lycium ferocissimum]|uniref:uncharacterized protein LOC132031942 n=1 Tax=Lycium ferocissimum TaxID=112874 RepID=UPI0028156E36|nr:uncharacterized protein LOC132031942 [Lycium ferocissimum]
MTLSKKKKITASQKERTTLLLGRKYKSPAIYTSISISTTLLTELLHTAIIANANQQITIKMLYGVTGKNLFITSIYAKCTAFERKDIWLSLENVYPQVDGPWCLGGDFNVILDPMDKLGGKPHRMYKSMDFNSCIDNCELIDLGMWGQGSLCIVEDTWNVQISRNPMWILLQKLKILSKKLSQWSREVIGNVYDKVNVWEAKMQDLENMDSSLNTEKTREELNKGNAEYIRWLDMQDKLLKKKAHIKWTDDGDRNNKYFYCLIRDRTRRLQLHRIKKRNGSWVQGDEGISKAAIDHFEHMFNLNHNFTDHNILNVIPECINHNENVSLTTIPDLEENVTPYILELMLDSYR